ncbi:MAG: SRPBCC family protein [Thermocrispum sp.]
MVSVSRTFTVDRPLDEVVGYLRDFARAEEWDPGTTSCERLDDGPVAEGSRWRNVSNFLGRRVELTYRLDRLEPRRLTFAGENDAATSEDDLVFRPSGDGTEITYRAQITFTGALRLVDPLLRLPMEKVASSTVKTMTRALESG